MAVAGLALGAVAVGAGVVYLLESPTSPVPYSTSRETPHEAGPLKGILQGIPDLMWPENKNPFAPDGPYYEHKAQWELYPQGLFGVGQEPAPAPKAPQPLSSVGAASSYGNENNGLHASQRSATSGPAKIRQRDYF